MTFNRFGRTRLLGLASVALLCAGQAQAACNGNANDATISQAAVTSAVEGSTFAMSVHPSAKGAVYTWSWVSGPVPTFTPTTGEQINITAPQIPGTSPAVMRIRLTASGCNRADATSTLDINITQLTNIEPVALASASPSSVNEGGAVSLIGTSSYDPDSDPITYAWTQVGGPSVTINNASSATAGFTAPSVATTTSLTFRLTVTENTVAAKSSYQDVIVNVLNVNVPPVAALSCPAEVDEGDSITLDGSASNDPDSSVLDYSFSQLTGLPLASIPPGPYGSSVSFDAPVLGFGQTGLVKFGLTVTDGDGASASADCSVFINDVTAPVLSGGGDQTLEATSPAGAVATYVVESYDNVDGAGGATCVPPSGSDFPLGATPVACAQADSSGNIGELGFTITVEDTTPPVIDAHADVTEEATSPAGAIVEYTAPATSDLYDGAGTASCVPPPGSQFALGNTTVDCSAADTSGNAATATSFNVAVVDTTAPDITAPADITVEATGPLTTVALVDATATDAVGPVTITNDAPAQFVVGTTVVTWTATDGAMNSASTTSNVTVQDTTPPSIAFHADVNAIATSAAGAVVSYTLPTATDLVDGSVAVTCLPASGSTFAVGSTTVNCSATDSHGNTGYSSFKVIVSYAFTGFFKPIDNLPIVNVTKAGQAIPVKFSLGGNMGLNIFAAGYPKSIQMACGGSAEDAIEETTTAGGSSLSYDATTGQYIYVWKSEKAWAGTCRQLQVKFADGQVRYANFSFTR